MSKHSPLRHLRSLVLPLCSLVILLLLSRLVEWGELRETFARARWIPLFAAFVVTLPFPLMNTLRWYAVLKAVRAPVSLWRAFEITMACWPIGILTPGKAGELLKATVVPRKTIGVGTVFAEKVIDLFLLGVYGVVFGAIVRSFWCTMGGAAALGASATILFTARSAARLFRGKKIGEKLQGLVDVLPRLMRQKRLLAACALSSAMNWFLSIAQMWFLLEAFGAPTPLPLVIAIVPGATLAGLLPIPTAGGAGPREAAFLFLGGAFITREPLFAAAIMYSVLGYFMLGAMGLPFLGALTKAREVPRDTRRAAARQWNEIA